MNQYLFHLVFELLAPDADRCNHSDKADEQSIFKPPLDLDIFQTVLPRHSILYLGESIGDSDDILAIKRSDSDCSPISQVDEQTRHTLISSYCETVSRETRPGITKDWRFDKVSIISIDMISVDGTSAKQARGRFVGSEDAGDRFAGGASTMAKFVPSEAKNTEFGWGIVHLYREAAKSAGLGSDSTDVQPAPSISAANPPFQVDICSTLCILAVPSYMSPSDLLGYLGEYTRQVVSHFRMIRTARVNRYMVLMKFNTAGAAREWQQEWNGRPFNAMEPEYCHVVFVASITFQTDQLGKACSFPNMSDDPFIPSVQPKPTTVAGPSADAASPAALTSKSFGRPAAALVELPTCPVCLERMDETTGLLIILCQHVFHCACLEKWRGTGCPVCRYTQNSKWLNGTRTTGASTETSSACNVCSSEQNLWICLICGNLGCGRYDSAHAFAHWEETRHSYAMDIVTQHVWDYAGDGYVHRLIQNKTDGKMMDLPAASHGIKDLEAGAAAYGPDMVPREKMEAMGHEYVYLLQSQLDDQRQYFEEQLEQAVDQASKNVSAAEKATEKIDTLLDKMQSLQEANEETKGQMQTLTKETERMRKKADKAEALARKMSTDWREEKAVNDSLLERIKHLNLQIVEEQKKRQTLQAEKQEIEEENRDLTFFISSSERLKQASDDIVQGIVEVPVHETAASSKTKKGKRK